MVDKRKLFCYDIFDRKPNGGTMTEIERLKKWMKDNDYSVLALAGATGMSKEGMYMILWRKKVSPGFKLRFTYKFGAQVADQIFTAPEISRERAYA
jgi:hypothetical protein